MLTFTQCCQLHHIRAPACAARPPAASHTIMHLFNLSEVETLSERCHLSSEHHSKCILFSACISLHVLRGNGFPRWGTGSCACDLLWYFFLPRAIFQWHQLICLFFIKRFFIRMSNCIYLFFFAGQPCVIIKKMYKLGKGSSACYGLFLYFVTS